MSDKKTITICGDVLEIHWDGNVWVAPSCGAQYARARDAMRAELELYIGAGGDNPYSEESQEEIADLLDQMS